MKNNKKEEKKSNQFDKTIFQFYLTFLLWLSGWEGEIAKNRHIVYRKARKIPEKIRAAENIMTAQKIGKNCSGRKLYFFTIIADILFGYCDVFVGLLSTYTHAAKHKNDLV